MTHNNFTTYKGMTPYEIEKISDDKCKRLIKILEENMDLFFDVSPKQYAVLSGIAFVTPIASLCEILCENQNDPIKKDALRSAYKHVAEVLQIVCKFHMNHENVDRFNALVNKVREAAEVSGLHCVVTGNVSDVEKIRSMERIKNDKDVS